MKKLKAGDDSGFETPLSSFVNLRGEAMTSNPRITPEYRQECCDVCGLGKELNKEQYGYLRPDDVELLRWVVKRGSSSMWLPNSARTSARGFKHRLITRGPPVRVPLHRLSREATEW